ncbi:mitogen-activated protein kinase kinase kinase 18-like protein [Tanacetum coccineum]
MSYTKGHVIGRGSSATVSLAKTADGELVAVKSTSLSTSLLLQKEQQFLAKLSSPHVIKYIGFDIDYDSNNNIPMYDLLLEYAPRGTISDVIKKQGGCLDESLIKSYTHQILLGLEYLHSNSLVHCDIKCDNILVFNDCVKIGDLGCAKWVEQNGENMSTRFGISGTPVFMAPEVARGEEQGFKADVWALGCAIIEMATGSNPWPEINNPVSGLYKIGYSGEVPLFPMLISNEAKDFLSKCLQLNVEERWSVKELLQHPFVKLTSGFEKIETLSRNSPSSVLDQGYFWDSLEVVESSPEMTRIASVFIESPIDRIRQLVQMEGSISCLPTWVDEEDWINVRTNHMDESVTPLEENLYVNVEDDVSESTHIDSVLVSELYVEIELSNPFTMMLGSNVTESSGANVVSRFLDCKNMNNDNCLLIDSNTRFALSVLLYINLPSYINLVYFS